MNDHPLIKGDGGGGGGSSSAIDSSSGSSRLHSLIISINVQPQINAPPVFYSLALSETGLKKLMRAN